MTQSFEPRGLTNETLLAVIQERLDGFMREVREAAISSKLELSQINFTVKELEHRERERNGQLKEAVAKHAINDLRWIEHMAASVKSMDDLSALQRVHNDALTRSKVYQQWWVWAVMGGMATGGIVQGLNYLGVF